MHGLRKVNFLNRQRGICTAHALPRLALQAFSHTGSGGSDTGSASSSKGSRLPRFDSVDSQGNTQGSHDRGSAAGGDSTSEAGVTEVDRLPDAWNVGKLVGLHCRNTWGLALIAPER